MKLAFLIIDPPVKVPDILRTGALKECVDVLCDVHDIEMSSELRNCIVGRIWLALKAAEKTLLVKIKDKQSIAFPSFRGSDILDAVLFP